jgi:hypothetical protein
MRLIDRITYCEYDPKVRIWYKKLKIFRIFSVIFKTIFKRNGDVDHKKLGFS